MYLELLVRHWITNRFTGRLELLVSESFRERHGSFCAFIKESATHGVTLSTFRSRKHREGIASVWEVLRNDLSSGRVLERHIRKSRPDHVVLMMFDHCQTSLATRVLRHSTLSGIYFRPTFRPTDGENSHSDAGLIRRRELLRAAISNPALTHLFVLDPRVIEEIKGMRSDLHVLSLPDGYSDPESDVDPADVRSRLGIAPDRKIVLFFGVVSARKGIFEMLEAADVVHKESQTSLSLVIAGKIATAERKDILAAIDRTRSKTNVQLVLLDRFVEETEISPFFKMADVVVVTYRNHAGSSNVLIRAAASATPVVGTDQGLVGEWIRDHHLGVSVPSEDSEAVARGIEDALYRLDRTPFDPDRALAFSKFHSADAFAQTIFSAARVTC